MTDPQSFERLAANYDRRRELFAPHDSWLPGVLPARGSRAVDLGCGTGAAAVMLSERFDEVLGVDISPAMIDVARARRPRPNITYVVADLHEVSGQFDFVLSVNTLHHVKDLPGALRRIRGLVSPGGVAVIADVVTWLYSPLPRWFFRLGAMFDFALDVTRRQQHARERYRLRTEPAWVDHLASDRFLRPRTLKSELIRAFPGAEILRLGRGRLGGVRGCRWQRALGSAGG